MHLEGISSVVWPVLTCTDDAHQCDVSHCLCEVLGSVAGKWAFPSHQIFHKCSKVLTVLINTKTIYIYILVCLLCMHAPMANT